MRMTTFQKAAAWAVVQAMFAGCSGGGNTTASPSPPTSSPAPAPTPDGSVHITRQPSDTAVLAGTAATFSVSADDIGAAFQWYRDGTPIAGAVASSYTLAAAALTDNGASLTVKVTNAEGSVTSTAAKLTVTAAATPTPAPTPTPPPPPPPTPPSPAPTPTPSPSPSPSPTAPSITTQPAAATALTGATATFTVVSAGTSPTYQWKKNGVAISGATSASYTTPPVTYVDNGANYSVVATNSAGSATSNPASLLLTRSADQTIFETFELPPGLGVYETEWSLNYVGTQISGTNYIVDDYSVMTLSPLTNGPQTVQQSAPANVTNSLNIVFFQSDRVLVNGAVLLVPGQIESFHISYVLAGVQIDYLASDNSTVAYTQVRSNYSMAPLTGLLHAAPAELTNPYNSIFANPGVLDTTTSWMSGASYMKFTSTELGDRYNVFDCNGFTAGATPNPCQSSTTLDAALAAGEISNSDATTYHAADGTRRVVGGIDMWVANNPRPAVASGTNAYTRQYRVYFAMNGNVYTGALIKDGTVVSTFHYRTDPNDATTTVYLPYQVRLNSPAEASLKAGSLL